mmetsp:Transcript_11107/g.32988  ORF Transcript_11107/g.32988 Transcript_11107/m.32988 type:complete len:587 (-) Transcript_11107:613-2373(-)
MLVHADHRAQEPLGQVCAAAGGGTVLRRQGDGEEARLQRVRVGVGGTRPRRDGAVGRGQDHHAQHAHPRPWLGQRDRLPHAQRPPAHSGALRAALRVRDAAGPPLDLPHVPRAPAHGSRPVPPLALRQGARDRDRRPARLDRPDELPAHQGGQHVLPRAVGRAEAAPVARDRAGEAAVRHLPRRAHLGPRLGRLRQDHEIYEGDRDAGKHRHRVHDPPAVRVGLRGLRRHADPVERPHRLLWPRGAAGAAPGRRGQADAAQRQPGRVRARRRQRGLHVAGERQGGARRVAKVRSDAAAPHAAAARPAAAAGHLLRPDAHAAQAARGPDSARAGAVRGADRDDLRDDALLLNRVDQDARADAGPGPPKVLPDGLLRRGARPLHDDCRVRAQRRVHGGAEGDQGRDVLAQRVRAGQPGDPAADDLRARRRGAAPAVGDRRAPVGDLPVGSARLRRHPVCARVRRAGHVAGGQPAAGDDALHHALVRHLPLLGALHQDLLRHLAAPHPLLHHADAVGHAVDDLPGLLAVRRRARRRVRGRGEVHSLSFLRPSLLLRRLLLRGHLAARVLRPDGERHPGHGGHQLRRHLG